MKQLENFRPMLAATLPSFKGGDIPTEQMVENDLKKLDWSSGYGFMCSIKMDGIRAIKHPTLGLVSRTLKPIRNKHIQELFSSQMLDGFDGELVLGEVSDKVDFNSTQSAVMSEAGRPRVTFNIFDTVLLEPSATFIDRHLYASNIVDSYGSGSGVPVRIVPQIHVHDISQLLKLEEEVAAAGYEGLIVRHSMGRYKNNRSTFREQGMIKLKRFVDGEAEVIGFEELLRNMNEAYSDNLGYQKRSASIENQVPGGTLGKLLVRGIDPFPGVEFAIGSGFDMATRDMIWRNASMYLGKIVKYKYQPVGTKNAPRAPIFLGFRDRSDMGIAQ